MARRGSADLLVKRRASLLSLYIAHRIGFRLRQKIARARPLRISFKIRVICIFSAQKLQDNLHNFLHVLRIVFSGKISVKKFYETFAMLDKSVYHIVGEDCARCTLYAHNSNVSGEYCQRFRSLRAYPRREISGIPPLLHPFFAIFRFESVNYAFLRQRSAQVMFR